MGLMPLGLRAAKTVYIPSTWVYNSSTQEYTEGGNSDLQWSYNRSKQSDNCIVFWQKGFGSNPSSAPSLNGTDMTFDVDAVLQVAEQAYTMNVNTLGFDSSNMMNNYKIIILMNYTTTWTCYGGGYDFKCSALWLNPATVKPAGSALAHEVGHSFHYMCYGEDSNFGANSSIQTGFHGAVGNGATIWETTANWQALALYPNEFFSESGTVDIFQKSHNYAFTHEWHRYQAYPFLYYICQKYNSLTTISDVWKYHETNVKDFNQVLMDYKGLSVEQLYRLHFDFAMHAVTYDLDAPSPYLVSPYMSNNYIGKFNYNKVKLGTAKYQVAYSSCPQSTGFNVIPLNVPSTGTTITTKFTALAPGCTLADGDPAEYLNGESVYASSGRTSYNTAVNANTRGFRIGYVCLLNDGTRVYYDDNTRHCTGTGTKTENVTYEVPANVQKMWLVVSPTPSTYIQHQWDENYANDDQWPYQLEFVNTDILGESTIDGRDIADCTITYNVTLKPDDSGHSGTTITINGSDLATIGTAFQLESDEIFSKLVTYSSSGPSNGQIMNYAANADGSLQSAAGNTNGFFGHWFNTSGTVVAYANGYVFAEGSKDTKSITIGQYPGKNQNGATRTIREAFRYKDNNGNTATAYMVFNITFSSSATNNNATIASIDYTAPSTTYSVTYNGRTVSQGAGFEIVSGANATKVSNTSLTTSESITTSNISSYITATPVGGYKTTITVNGTTIEITYTSITLSTTSSSTKPTNITAFPGSGNTYALTVSQNGRIEHSINIADIQPALGKSTSTSFETDFKTTDNFSNYGALNSSMSTSKFYYYALNTAPYTNNFSYYATNSNTNDANMGSGVYTHYYVVTGENSFGVTTTANKEYASFKVGYDITNAKFIIQATEDCPIGTYEKVRLGFVTKSGSKYYCAYYTFDITVTEPIVTKLEETLNVKRYTGQGYTTTTSTVDFTTAKTFLGISEVTTDMLRIVNPDGTIISDYATYDGWFNTDGVATTWINLGSNAGINSKFFQAIPNGTYTICDMNGADVAGTTYTVKWALVANDKTYTYNINVSFVEKPAVEYDFYDLTQIGSDIVVNFTSTLGSYYEGLNDDVDVPTILSTLEVTSLSDVTIYAVQSDGTLDDNYKLGGTDGWRKANGDWQSYGDNSYFYVKADFSATTEIYEVGGMIGKNTTDATTYTAKYAFVKNSSATHDAVILKVNLTYEVGSVVLAETLTSYETDAAIHNVTLQRSLPAGKWLSFCAPFNIYGNEFEGMGISRAMSLESVTKDGGTITLNFADTDNIMVGVPVIIKMSETKTGITKNNTGYGSYEATPTTTVENGTLTAKMIGTYVKIDLPDDVYYLQDDKFRHTTYTGTTATAMKGWRAYFTITDSANEVKAVRYNLDGEDVEPTDIEGIVISTNDNVQSTIFDLSGRRVQHPAKGFYIVNGKKMFVK